MTESNQTTRELEVDERSYEEIARASRAISARAKRLWLGVAVAAFIIGVGFAYSAEIGRAFEPTPKPYDPSADVAHFSGWMREALPNYVIAVGQNDQSKSTEARDEFLQGSTFHDGMRRRATDLAKSVEAFQRWSNDALAMHNDVASEKLDDIGLAVARLDAMLREIGAPYSVDHDVGAIKDGIHWKLRFLVRTSEITGVSRFRATRADGVVDDVRVARVRRIDNLNVLDLVHGKTRGSVAFVLDEGARGTAVNRYLPGLAGKGPFRNMFEHSRDPAFVLPTEDDEGIHANLEALLTSKGGDALFGLKFLALKRSLVLQSLQTKLQKRIKLIAPNDFFFDDETCDQLSRWSTNVGIPEPNEDLHRFCRRDTTLPAETQAMVETAVSTLAELFLRGVERHEAWHVISTDPPPLVDAPPRAAREMVAYLGALADAEDEACILWEQLRQGMREAAKHQRNTPTAVAMRALSARFGTMPGVHVTTTDCRPATQHARALLAELFQETRQLQFVEYESGARLLHQTNP